MNAREMFEKLGYNSTVFDNGTIRYSKTKKDKTSRVNFYLDNKVYDAYYVELSTNGVEHSRDTRLINIKLNKAIQQQIKELNWEE